MVVDDDEDIRETIALLLQDAGYSTLESSSGPDALARLKACGDVAVILLDLRMPEMSGTEVVKELKGDPALARIPVVVMSGDTAARAIAAGIGADACLVKPIELTALLATADRYVRSRPSPDR
jgi:CheY-like chemotaxis protein